MKKVRWGVLSTARIGIQKVIPAMQLGKYCDVRAIASQSQEKADLAARQLNLAKSYGSYQALLADPDIDAVYIPLPNHLHVPWSLKALEAGKHVLCEKPIALNGAEARMLLDAAKRHPQLKVMEAFMYRHHPQWQLTHRLVTDGKIGELRTIQSFFSYYNADPGNVRNQPDIGGGGLMDIGCYCISLARFLFGTEPQRVFGIMEFDPRFKVDCLTSGVLDFGGATSTFTCATQLAPFQRVNILGTLGRVEIKIPFNAPPDQPCEVICETDSGLEVFSLDSCDQYTLQGDLLARAILEHADVPTPLEDAVANMKVIDALVHSAKNQTWSRND